mgnify:CR=1 FL=1
MRPKFVIVKRPVVGKPAEGSPAIADIARRREIDFRLQRDLGDAAEPAGVGDREADAPLRAGARRRDRQRIDPRVRSTPIGWFAASSSVHR